jgi:hypothetical protein
MIISNTPMPNLLIPIIKTQIIKGILYFIYTSLDLEIKGTLQIASQNTTNIRNIRVTINIISKLSILSKVQSLVNIIRIKIKMGTTHSIIMM